MFVDLFASWSSQMNAIAEGNQFLAGSLSLWALTVITILCRNVPKAIYMFSKRNFTTTMTMNNAGFSQERVMFSFLNWLQPRLSESFSRTLSINTNNFNEYESNVGVGYGLTFFFFDKKFFWLFKNKLESSGSERQKDEIVLGTFGRSHKPFHKLIEEFMPKPDNSKNSIFSLTEKGNWEHYTRAQKRFFDSVAMPKDTKNTLIEQISHFRDNPQWYYDRSLPYKLTYVLHGKPGTGKTSIIKAVASEFNMNLCILNIHLLTDKNIERAFATVPDNSVIIIEDFDSSSAAKSREASATSSGGNDFSDFSFLTLTGLLNTLDGITPLDNCLLFLTTNHLEHIDPALYRKGRVDHILEIDELDGKVIKDHAQYLYPHYNFNGYEFKPSVGCNLNEALMYGKDDPERFIESLKSNNVVVDKTESLEYNTSREEHKHHDDV